MMMMMMIMMIIIIIIIINCSWVVTRWQWLFYIYTEYEIGYKEYENVMKVGILTLFTHCTSHDN